MQLYNLFSQDTAATAESLSVMMQKEQAIYKCSDYLHPSTPAQDTMITETDRLHIIDWCYGIIDYYNFHRETVSIAVEMVDRFLSKPTSITEAILNNRKQFHLLTVAALYIAIKTNERVALRTDFFASTICHGVYTVDEIEAVELTILNGLSWRVCAPTSIHVAHLILSLILPHVDLAESTWGLILEKVNYHIEHAVRDYYFVTQRRSTVALAAIFNALDQVERVQRQAVLRALLLVNDKKFDSPQVLLAARNRLRHFVQRYESMTNEASSVSESSQECESWSRNRKLGCPTGQNTIIGSPRRSPRSVNKKASFSRMTKKLRTCI